MESHLQPGAIVRVWFRSLFLFAEFVAVFTLWGLGKRFAFERGSNHVAMHENHVGQAAAKRGGQCPEQ